MRVYSYESSAAAHDVNIELGVRSEASVSVGELSVTVVNSSVRYTWTVIIFNRVIQLFNCIDLVMRR